MGPIIATVGISVLAVASGITLVWTAETLLGLSSGPRAANPVGPNYPKLAVLVPAHNEEKNLAKTITCLQAQLRNQDRLLVVADNCTDTTADVARALGANVLERQDPNRKGKGYALRAGIRALAQDPPDVLVVVDADCELGDGSLAALALRVAETNRPAQADNTLRAPSDTSIVNRVSAFAFRVRNRVRARGLQRLAGLGNLCGTGMALPWRLAATMPDFEDHLTEDLAMGLELALKGAPATYCPDAQVLSDLPADTADHATQRRRWEHGQLFTARQYAPRLFAAALAGHPSLAWLGLDLLVPPLSLHVASVAGCALCGGALWALGQGPVVAGIAAGQLGLIGAGVLAAWWQEGRPLLPLGQLLLSPTYILWKTPVYLRYLLRGRDRVWMRTART